MFRQSLYDVKCKTLNFRVVFMSRNAFLCDKIYMAMQADDIYINKIQRWFDCLPVCLFPSADFIFKAIFNFF